MRMILVCIAALFSISSAHADLSLNNNNSAKKPFSGIMNPNSNNKSGIMNPNSNNKSGIMNPNSESGIMRTNPNSGIAH